jgi:hypothetical protein
VAELRIARLSERLEALRRFSIRKRPNNRTTCRPMPRNSSHGFDGIRAFADTRTDGKAAAL